MDIPLKVWIFTKTISHLSLGDYRYIYILLNDNHLDLGDKLLNRYTCEIGWARKKG